MTDASAHIDGGSRGNPGPAAYAVVLRRPGFPVYEECDVIGVATNNVAEYTALIRALGIALDLKLDALAVFSDSELLVRQMKGEYKVKSQDLLGLFQEAVALRAMLPKATTFTHVKREFNRDADRLCNEALDGRPRRPISDSEAALDAVPELDLDPIDAAGLACLSKAAHSWAARGPADPPPLAVWRELRAILARNEGES